MSDRTPFLWDEPSFGRAAAPRGSLEERIGMARDAWTVEDLVAFSRHEHVRVTSLMHVGADGWLKALDFVPRSDEHLRDVLLGGERADGSSLFAGLGIPSDASDVVLRPRPTTAFLHPFTEVPTLVVLCGHLGRDGRPLACSPDTIVRRAHQLLLTETGIALWALGEVEFFLGKRAVESDAYGADERGYHATAPFVFGEGLRRRALACLADLGIPVKYGHSEVGYVGAAETGGWIWEQHEIELDLLPLPEAADAVVLTQWVLRCLAQREGLRCSTAPVVAERHAGNGLHVHLAIRERGVDLAGRDAQGLLTLPSQWLLVGLVEMAPALMAFGNRVPESFARLAGGRETPRAVTWGEFDRSALVRLPVVPRTEDGRPIAAPTIELRLPDGSALPHLVGAGIAQAMRWARTEEQLEERLARTRSRNVHAGRTAPPTPVPASFAAVGRALAARRDVLEAGDVFPGPLIDAVLERLEADRPPA